MNNGKVSFAKKPTTPTVAAEPMPAIAGVESVSGAGPATTAAITPAAAGVPAPYVPPTSAVPAPYTPVEANTQRMFSDTALDDLYELRLPALNIVQGVGELCQQFDAGSIVIDKTLPILPAPPKQVKLGTALPEIDLVIIGARPVVFVEKQAVFEAGAPTQRFNTEAEVAAAGGTVDYNRAKRDGVPYYERLVTLLALVRKPDAVEDLSKFPFAIPTAKDPNKVEAWAPTILHLKGTQYTNGFTQLATARRTGAPIQLRKGYFTRVVRARTYYKAFQTAGHGCFLWTFSDGGPSDPNVVAEGFDLIGQPSPDGTVAPSKRD